MRAFALSVVLLVGFANAGAVVAAPSETVAVLAAVRGHVEVFAGRGASATPATFGQALRRGDRVTVGKGGSATLFFGDGNVVTLGERGSITVGGRASEAGAARELPQEVFAQVSQYVTSGSRETGLVSMSEMRSDADTGSPLLVAPRNTAVLEDAPVFEWRSVPGAIRYRVSLAPVGGPETWSREVPAASGPERTLAYPPDAAPLADGREYEWEVTALDDRGSLRRESARVRLLAKASRDDVRANLERIASGASADTAAARFLSGSYLCGLELYDAAARQFRELSALVPGSAAPHEALGNLYLKVGASDRAAAEFRQALALHRETR
ncbi:MAG: hypothetical protein IT347_02850 [Candidatus Eisenbacteria bacterium]|nr:hypothetical protein [Candidatus Eisenbacteria bacterium]